MSKINSQPKVKTYVLADYMVIQKSKNLFNWENAEIVNICEEKIHGHYFTLLPRGCLGNPFAADKKEFSVLISGSALDVKGFDI